MNRTAAAEDPMTNQPTTAPESTSLDVTRDEADLIIDASDDDGIARLPDQRDAAE